MMAKKKLSNKQNPIKFEGNKKYIKYIKKCYYAKDCYFSNKKIKKSKQRKQNILCEKKTRLIKFL